MLESGLSFLAKSGASVGNVTALSTSDVTVRIVSEGENSSLPKNQKVSSSDSVSGIELTLSYALRSERTDQTGQVLR